MTEFRNADAASVDREELARFSKLGDSWWDADGPQRALHKLNPARVLYLRNLFCGHFPDGRKPRDRNSAKPLAGLRIVDLGCGGGLLSEPLTALGASVSGIDPSEENIAAARRHAAIAGLEIDYRPLTVEALAESGETFDIVLAMEVLEHVADVKGFLSAAAALVRPGGLFVGATSQPHPEKLCSGDRRRGILSCDGSSPARMTGPNSFVRPNCRRRCRPRASGRSTAPASFIIRSPTHGGSRAISMSIT